MAYTTLMFLLFALLIVLSYRGMIWAVSSEQARELSSTVQDVASGEALMMQSNFFPDDLGYRERMFFYAYDNTGELRHFSRAPQRLEDEVLELVRSHHERYDGMGYPDKRPAKELSLPTRILCVADAYDAMTSDRPYRKGMENEKVFSILRECKGTQFDPDVVEALIRSMEK